MSATVAFRSISGVPRETAQRIVRFLDAAAFRADLALLNYQNAPADYQLWGAIEVMNGEEKVKLLYAWEVQDRVGRHVGQKSGIVEFITSPAGEVWGGVPDAVLQTVAKDGIAALMSHEKRHSHGSF